jgi:predicted nucleic acid-binding protein
VKGEVFLDSGIFIAFLVSSDRLHEESVTLFSHPPKRWCTSVLVISEVYSWYLHRLGEETARTFRSLLESMTDLEILTPDAAHLAAVWRKLDAFRGHKLTYVDASSLVWLKKRRIKTVWGTDHHLGIEGATVLPGSPLF